MTPSIPRIALTPGEPAGIGPDLLVMAAQREWPAELIAIADPEVLTSRAGMLKLPLTLKPWTAPGAGRPAKAGQLSICEQPLATTVTPGQPDPANATALLGALNQACDGCMNGLFDAMVTGPIHKAVINDAGIAFTGHTEYLAVRSGATRPVMLLVADKLRVALVTTHLPLREVPDRITADAVSTTTEVLHDSLQQRFGIDQPRITVLGLNPHAGESGHLGREEIEIIEPALDALRKRGMDITGPVPADTAFTEHWLTQTDAILAMYHDQGLAVLKHRGFGRSVNVTLGLPVLRTSVDHGTALELAGTGQANPGSLFAALELAIGMATARSRP